jgi:cbb3-type cytochrome oxidase subunit 3
MRLSDIMSGMQLSCYAEVALLLFLGAFVAVAVSVFWSRQTEDWEHCRHLPLDGEDEASSPTVSAQTTSTSPGATRHEPT